LRVARIEDLDFLQHTRNDHLDVLVVDLHPLQTIDLLDSVHQVSLHRTDTLDRQDIHGVDRPFGQAVAGDDALAFISTYVLAVRDQVLLLDVALADDHDPAQTACRTAELDHAVDLGHGGRFAGPPCLEQLGHTRQTTGDVAGLGDFARDLR